jgi:DNA-binding response OmpR family regulator
MTRSRDAGTARSDIDDRPLAANGLLRPPVVWLAEIEPELAALLAEWLAEVGIVALGAGGSAEGELAWPQRVDLVVVDIPFPRLGAPAQLQGLTLAWPHAPVLALSGTFFANVAARGAVARELGVAGVMAKPVSRDAWLTEVRRLLERPA